VGELAIRQADELKHLHRERLELADPQPEDFLELQRSVA